MKAALFVTIVVNVALSCLYGWCFMIAVALIHAHWIPAVPGIGYWWAVLISTFLRGALTGFSNGKMSNGNRR